MPLGSICHLRVLRVGVGKVDGKWRMVSLRGRPSTYTENVFPGLEKPGSLVRFALYG